MPKPKAEAPEQPVLPPQAGDVISLPLTRAQWALIYACLHTDREAVRFFKAWTDGGPAQVHTEARERNVLFLIERVRTALGG